MTISAGPRPAAGMVYQNRYVLLGRMARAQIKEYEVGEDTGKFSAPATRRRPRR